MGEHFDIGYVRYAQLCCDYFVGAGIYCDMQLTPNPTLPVSTMLLILPFVFTINREASGINSEVLYRTSGFGSK